MPPLYTSAPPLLEFSVCKRPVERYKTKINDYEPGRGAPSYWSFVHAYRHPVERRKTQNAYENALSFLIY